mgnify:CR=1 FL=1
MLRLCLLIQSTELGLSLLEHLCLMRCDALSLNLFLLSDRCLVLGNLGPAALTAPTLALSRPEVIGPHVSHATLNLNGRCLLSWQGKNLDLPAVLFGLHADSVYYFNAIVADLVLTVSELPEGNLTPMASLFLPSLS